MEQLTMEELKHYNPIGSKINFFQLPAIFQ